MKTIEQIEVAAGDREAIDDAAAILRARFGVSRLVLFGSKARGDDDPESDIDLLVLTGRPVSREEKDAITDSLFDTQIHRQVVLSPLVVSRADWDSPMWRVLPIHQQIEPEGVVI